MNSFNHYALGSIGEWLYGGVAGIDQAPDSVAYRELVIRPLPGELTWARASYESVRGRHRACRWRGAAAGSGHLASATTSRPARTAPRVHLPGRRRPARCPRGTTPFAADRGDDSMTDLRRRQDEHASSSSA